MGDLVQREHPQNWATIGMGSVFSISEMVQDGTNVTMTPWKSAYFV